MKAVQSLAEGEILLLENIRFYLEEERNASLSIEGLNLSDIVHLIHARWERFLV